MGIYGKRQGSIFERKGGDAALQQRYDAMRAVASPEQKERSLFPEQLKTAFHWTMDKMLRTNYAVAGAFDTLVGEGRDGEYVPQRMWREMFGKGDKEFFGDVLKQAGMGEGGKLSDVLPDGGVQNFLTIGGRFDPTLRGTLGLGLDVLLDPMTWVHGTGKLMRVAGIGRGSDHLFTASGRGFVAKEYDKIVAAQAKVLGLGEKATERETLLAMGHSQQFWDYVGTVKKGIVESNEALLVAQTQKYTQRLAAQTAAQLPGAIAKPGLRIGYLGLPDVPLYFDRVVGKVGGKAGEMLTGFMEKGSKRRAALAMFTETRDDLYKLFNTNSYLSKFVPGYRTRESELWMMRQGAQRMAREEAKGLLEVAGVGQKQLDNAQLWENFGDALEAVEKSPQARDVWLAEARSAGIENPQNFWDGWVTMAEKIRVDSVKAGLIVEGEGERWAGRYMPRQTRGLNEKEARRLQGKGMLSPGEMKGASEGRYAEARTANTRAEFRTAMEEMGAAGKIVSNPAEWIADRLTAHYDAMLTTEFLDDLVSAYGVHNSDDILKLRQVLSKVGVEATEKQLQTLKGIEGRSTTLNDDVTEAMAARIDELRGTPAHKVLADLTENIEKLRGKVATEELNKHRLRVLKAQKKLEVGEARSEVRSLMAERSANAVEAKEARRLRGLARASEKDIKGLTKEQWSGALAELRGNMAGARKSLKEIAKRADKGKFKDVRLKEQLSDNLVAISRIESEIAGTVAPSVEKVRKLGGLLDDLAETRREIRRDIEDWGFSKLADQVRLKDFNAELRAAQQVTAPLRREIAAARKYARVLKKRNPLTAKEIKRKDVQALLGLPEGLRAVFMERLLSKVKNIGQFDNVMKKYSKVFDSIGDDAVLAARRAVDPALPKYKGQQMFPHKFEKGALRGQEFTLPEGVVQDFENFSGVWQSNPEVRGILRLFDYVTNTFKVSVTRYFPAFNFRNMYSNVGSTANDIGLQILNPFTRDETWKIMSGRDGYIKTNSGRRVSYQQARDELSALNITPDRLAHAEKVGRETGLDIPELMARKWRGNKVVGAVMDAPMTIENEAKIFHYVSLIRRDFTSMDAARHVQDFLFDYARLSPFERNVMRRVFPFFTWSRKNLTRQTKGWLGCDEVKKGDTAIVLDHETHELSRGEVEDVAHFEFEGEMLRLENKRMSVLCTEDHRWATTTHECTVTGHHYDERRTMKRCNELKTNNSLVVGGDFRETESALSPESARLFGWLLTDGYWRWRGNHLEAMIYQSPKKFLEEVTEVAGGKPRKPHPDTGVVCVPVRKERLVELREWMKRDKNGEGWADLVAQLSREAAEEMFWAMYRGDGTVSEKRKGDFIAAQLSGVRSTVQALAPLVGLYPRATKRGFYLSRNLKSKVTSLKPTKEWYAGRVWCPKTSKGTWIMRWRGTVVVTGNTWTRKNLTRQIKNLKDAPGYTTMQYKPFRDRGPDADSLPDFVRGSLYMEMHEAEGSSFLTNIDLPITKIDMLWQGGLGKTIKDAFTMMNPIIKNPVELAMDMDSFTGQSIRGRKFMGRIGPMLDRNLPKPLKEWLEIDKVEAKDGNTYFTANGTKLYLATKGLVLGRFLSAGTTADEFAREIGDGNVEQGAFAMMRLLTGLHLRDFDLDEEQLAMLRNRSKRLEDILMDAGTMAEMRKRYIPAEYRDTKPKKGWIGR